MISVEALTSIRGPNVRFVDDATRWPTDLQMQESGLFLAEIHGRENVSKQDFVLEIEAAFQFPYFGRNWDALNDCLRDMSWVSASGYVVRRRNPQSTKATSRPNPMSTAVTNRRTPPPTATSCCASRTSSSTRRRGSSR